MIKPGQVIKNFTSKKNNEVIIRAPRENDVHEILEMMNSIIKEDDYIIMDEPLKLEDEIKWLEGKIKANREGTCIYLIAEVNGKIVGGGEVSRAIGRLSHTGSLGIAIKDGYREEGIGTEIIGTIIKIAKDDFKLKLITLEVYKTNLRAFNLYKKMGFIQFGLLPKEARVGGNFVDGIHMYKEFT